MPSYVLKRLKNYYKRVWEDWTQPVLTANGTMGGESFAVNQSSYYASNRQAWVAFDGVGNTGVDWNSAQGVPQWISWYNPVPLSISKITIVNTPEVAYPDTIKDYEVQVSDDNAAWKTIYSGTNTTGVSETWDIDLSNVENSSKYWRIYITSCNNRNYARIVELKITAKVQRIVESTSSDYDFMGDNQSYILKRKINKYYKDTVTTKYWKEVETTVVEYACYSGDSTNPYIGNYYAKTPIGSDMIAYAESALGATVTSSSQLNKMNATFSTLNESTAYCSSLYRATLSRNYAYDLYTTATTVVEGTPDDYTYTATETESVEVSANDDYDRVVAEGEPAYLFMVKE